MAILEVVYSRPGNEAQVFPLRYRVCSTPVASRWVTYLQDEIARDTPIEKHRIGDGMVNGHFIGLPNTGRNRANLAQYLNDCIETINAHQPGAIELRAHPAQDQEALNRLHKYFEVYRGPAAAPAAFYHGAPVHVRRALEDYKHLVQEFGDLIRPARESAYNRTASIHVVFMGRWLRHPLLPEDFAQFQLSSQFGDISAHYCEAGKPILDVYHDRDTVIGSDNVRPLEYLSASFDCYLGYSWTAEYTERYRADLQRWLRENGYDPNDERLSIGRIVLAQLIQDEHVAGLSRDAIIERLAQHANVKEVRVHH